MDTKLPSRSEMLDASRRRDATYEGVFIVCVRTTGIFCRPTCSARDPNPENVEFVETVTDALSAGYRPCRRCRPLEPLGDVPDWVQPLLDAVEDDATRRWRDQDLRDMGMEPARVRRWFTKHHGMTFHAYSRARRLGTALGRIQEGASVSRTAFGSGYDSLSGFGEAFRKLTGQAPTDLADAPVVRATRILTPLGPMLAAADDDLLYLLEFLDRRMLPSQFRRIARALGCVFAPGSSRVLTETHRQLEAYFDGRLTAFELPLRTPGTEFQEQVWRALRAIPYGETRSYAQVAAAIERPTAVRAVARANGANRMAIVIPCHRVIGADGSLTGYGGGLWRKRRLLELERRQTELPLNDRAL